MIVQPKVRGFICTTSHPVGCAKHIEAQINYVKSKPLVSNGPKKVLVIGSSTGFGLASRIMASFGGSQAATIGVYFDKEPVSGRRTATAGWYNNFAFEQKAKEAGLYAKSFNSDAFSDECKQEVVASIKKDLGQVDLVVYSLASPRRLNPRTGVVSKSVLRPIGQPYTNKSINLDTNEIEEVSLPQAVDEEIKQTVAVMGGEDWQWWIDALEEADALAPACETVAYSYVGPELTKGVYRNGTIGRAKDHLEATSKELDARLKKINGRAFISVNKALVTQSSSAIPFIPLYFVLLKKVMKEKGTDEGCIEQIQRLFADRLYSDKETPVDDQGFIRMDDWEMDADVQAVVSEAWDQLNNQNVATLADLDGYQEDFFKLFGFGLKGVDYDADIEVDPRVA